MADAPAVEEPRIRAKLVTLTPELAGQMLKANTHNRSVSAARVDQYAADIRAGNWQFNGEAIKIAADGQILDGQHRLWAVTDADRPIETMLVTGLPNESQETMDQGRARSVSDVLKLRGEKSYAMLAAAAKLVAFYQRDGLPYQEAYKPGVTVHQVIRTLERNPELRDSVAAVLELRQPWVPASAMAGLHYLFTVVDQADADAFLRKLMRGEDLRAGDPIWVLRERLIKAQSDRLNGIHPRIKLAFVIRTWNAWRAGEPMVRLVWSGGSNPDRFPRIDGLAVHANQDPEPEETP